MLAEPEGCRDCGVMGEHHVAALCRVRTVATAFVHLIPDDCPDCAPTEPCCSIHDACNDEGIAHAE